MLSFKHNEWCREGAMLIKIQMGKFSIVNKDLVLTYNYQKRKILE